VVQEKTAIVSVHANVGVCTVYARSRESV